MGETVKQSSKLTCVSQVEQDGARREAQVEDVCSELKPLNKRGHFYNEIAFTLSWTNSLLLTKYNYQQQQYTQQTKETALLCFQIKTSLIFTLDCAIDHVPTHNGNFYIKATNASRVLRLNGFLNYF